MVTPREVIQRLSEEIGPRFGGTESEHRAAYWLRDAMEAAGLSVRLQRYGFIGWVPSGKPSVRLVAPIQSELPSAPVIYSASTPTEGVKGRVLRHGTKHLISGLYELEAFSVLDESGDIAAQLLVEPSGRAIPLLNPAPIFRLPLVVISAEAGSMLTKLLQRGADVLAEVHIQTQLVPDSHSYNVIGEYRGAPSTTKRIVVDAHYDTQLDTPGAYDNASGVAGLFALAERVRGTRLPINIDFVAVASEEIGMHGSSYLVMDLVERGDLENVSFCICFDQISGGDTLWLWVGPDGVREKVVRSAHAANLGRLGPIRVDAPMPGCDMWPFYQKGVPGCLYMWWRLPAYHKLEDTIDKVDMAKLHGCVEAAYLLLKDLIEDRR